MNLIQNILYDLGQTYRDECLSLVCTNINNPIPKYKKKIFITKGFFTDFILLVDISTSENKILKFLIYLNN